MNVIIQKRQKSKPRVINSAFDASTMSSKEIDDKIVEFFRNGKDIYIINDNILKELRPDIIVAQGICEVCSPFTKEIKRAISILEYNPKVIILDPSDYIRYFRQYLGNSKKCWKNQRRTKSSQIN